MSSKQASLLTNIQFVCYFHKLIVQMIRKRWQPLSLASCLLEKKVSLKQKHAKSLPKNSTYIMHFLASTQPHFSKPTLWHSHSLSCEVDMWGLIFFFCPFLFLSLFISTTEYHGGWLFIRPLSMAVWNVHDDFPMCEKTSNTLFVIERSPTLTLILI